MTVIRAWSTNVRDALVAFLLPFATLATTVAAETRSVWPDPLVAPHVGFADETICASCHAEQTAAFARSDHAKAMAVADETTVRASFDDTRFEHDGVETRFFKRDNRFFVRTEGSDGALSDFEVKYTFGYHPLQQYLVDIGGGRLQALDIAWDAAKEEWIWLGKGSAPKPGSTYHWTGPFYRWNRTCIDCHSTDARNNFQPETGKYKSTYVATSVGCQSCHGGGARHVNWAQNPSMGSAAQSGAVMPKGDAGTCYACHSRRIKLLDGFGPGKAYLDYFSPALMRQDLYFPDGQILDEVFEYGSFQQSKMARAGVVCVDCHDAHAGTVRAEANALCTQCHAEPGSRRFAGYDPTGAFDTIAHTRHPTGSEGAQCVNCHMPQRTYMKVDPRRDHSFVVPRPDLSERYGIPNACTSCHEGKTNSWAAAQMDAWYGKTWRDRPTVAHAFASAAKGDRSSVEALRNFLADRKQSGFVRASAVAEIARVAGSASAPDVKAAATDHDALVRLGAAEAATNLPPDFRLDAIGVLLEDQARAVRVAAATALAGTQLELLGNERRAFGKAADDLKAYAEANADVAEVQGRYGLFLSGQGRVDEAEKVLLQAIVLDPTLAGSHVNLAEHYRLAGQNDKSERAYAAAVRSLPDNADLRYGHGLALVRTKVMTEAIEELEAALRLEPSDARYRTTLALALDAVGRTEEAYALLDKIIVDRTEDPDLMGTAIGLALKLGRHGEALTITERLARLQPDNSKVAALLARLRNALGK
ncbi:multiheme c-type cytochrome [Sinorhizobium chiapasense]|uniref:Multiheme c-type cytochrome n=1 Tax=Sinorhizobium chiapasense TaxID=501572 RepID=A0ABZ2BF93_9HYPH